VSRTFSSFFLCLLLFVSFSSSSFLCFRYQLSDASVSIASRCSFSNIYKSKGQTADTGSDEQEETFGSPFLTSKAVLWNRQEVFGQNDLLMMARFGSLREKFKPKEKEKEKERKTEDEEWKGAKVQAVANSVLC
jgi:hypothetical protein